MINSFKTNSASDGFTLIETLVAIFVFGVALTSVTAILITNNNTANFVKNSYIASGLAQEGVEVVRNLRDGDWLASRSFGAFGSTTGLPVADSTYRVQWNSTTLLANQDVFIKKDSISGIYSYDTGVNTPFKRTVQITTITSNVEKRIAVNVSWTERGIPRSINAEDHLYNWR